MTFCLKNVICKKLLFRVIGFSLKFLHFPISFLNGCCKDIWIFGSRGGRSFDENSKHLFKFISENHKSIRPIWISSDNEIISFLKRNGYEAYDSLSINGLLYIFLAHVCFVSVSSSDITPFKFLLNNKLNVQLWHGTPLRENNLSDLNDKYDVVCVSSVDFLTEQSLGCRVKFNFILTGYPRNDFIVKSIGNRKVTKETTILYMPTHRQRLSKLGIAEPVDFDLFDYGFDFQSFSEILMRYNVKFYLKLHPLQSLPSNLVLDLKKSNNIILLENDKFTDIYEMISQSDILVTDYSSVLFDYLLLDKPVFFTPFDLDEQTGIRKLRFSYDELICGPVAYNWTEFNVQLVDYFTNGDCYNKKREIVRDRFNYFKDSKSSERIFDLIYKNVYC